ncbi:hypothetical protein BSKO_05139 [Bryopsis sp. KO-2023]|nr:hypothetical protein BSKO_05139 [Bryopsis sp. KO-2023]
MVIDIMTPSRRLLRVCSEDTPEPKTPEMLEKLSAPAPQGRALRGEVSDAPIGERKTIIPLSRLRGDRERGEFETLAGSVKEERVNSMLSFGASNVWPVLLKASGLHGLQMLFGLDAGLEIAGQMQNTLESTQKTMQASACVIRPNIFRVDMVTAG